MQRQKDQNVYESVSIGIVGTGGLGTHVGKQFLDVTDAAVQAIADVNDENRREAGETLDVPPASQFDSFEAMLAAEPLDAVVIATPHVFHYDQVVTALDHGVHVLCEKPLTTDLAEARDLVRRTEESQQTVMVGYQRHLGRAYRRAKAELQDRSIEPKFITAEITQDWISQFEETWRADPELSGGGQLYDTGSHLIDSVIWMTDFTPTEVSAEHVFHDDEESVDTQALLNIRFREGAVANVSVSGDAPCVREHIHVWGDRGGVYVEGKEWDDRSVTTIEPDGDQSTPDGFDLAERNKGEAFVRAIRTDGTPPATVHDALSVTAVTEAAYESARTGERVTIDLE